MDCKQTLELRDDYLDGYLGERERLQIDRHLETCPRCRREFEQEREFRQTLRSMPVPPPTADFAERVFKEAKKGQEKSKFRVFTPYWGGAIAACLLLWLMIGTIFEQQPQAPGTVPPVVSIRLHEEKVVKVMVNAPRDLRNADVVVRLPGNVEMVGFPGSNEIRWQTDLRKGKNLLRLPLVAKTAGQAELVTRISHENKSKLLKLEMKIDNNSVTGIRDTLHVPV